MQEGCEFLILTDPAGRLDLRDAFVHDLELDIYARPTVSDNMPESPVRYVDVPWVVKYSGDSVYGKNPWQRVSYRAFLTLQRRESKHCMQTFLAFFRASPDRAQAGMKGPCQHACRLLSRLHSLLLQSAS